MINFISTFPPIMCGVGSYTSYLVSKMCPENWRVTSFELDQFSKTSQVDQFDQRVSYELSLAHPYLPPSSEGEVLWFQHAFGMWGRETDTFAQLVTEAKKRNAKVIATFHTIHFESDETQSGMCRKEEDLMNTVLPLLDAATVFSDGAYQALSKALPRYKNRIVVLRHGVHLYPWVSLEEARNKLLGYLAVQSNIPSSQKREIRSMYEDFFSPTTIVLGNHGFISPDKDPLALYQLGRLIRDRFPTHRVIALYIGKVPKRKDRNTEESIEILQSLKSIHDGRENLFFEDYLPEGILPYAYRSLDFCIFWYQNATQSGRIAHAQGTGTCVVGRRIEGLGETLDSAGLPSAVSLEDLAEKLGQLILQLDQKEEAEKLSKQYAERYSFAKQAQKHLLLASAARSRETLPALDRTKPDVTFILPRLALASRSGLEGFSDDGAAFLNVSDSNDLYPIPKIYHKIPLQDGTAVPVEKMKEAVDWIKRNIACETVIVFCRYGKGRSVSVIIAYLCAIGFNYQEAMKLVASKRIGAAPLPELSRIIEVILQT